MEGSSQSQIPQQKPVKVSAAEFNAKYRSKPEVYRFLAFECGAYLPSYDTVTVHHLRELAGTNKRRILASEVKTIHVPQFEGLTVETMLFHAKAFPQVQKALPSVHNEVLMLPRAYIANIIFTLVGPIFKKWVDEVIAHRN